MVIMGIDSSTPQSSVALLKNGRVLDQAEIIENSTPSSQVLRLVDKVLTNSDIGLEDVDGLCLTIGPGSFTGLRVGTSLLKGLILATSKPFVKVDTLEATAFRAMPISNKICAVLDARKKEVYTAFFQPNNGNLERLTPDRAITPDQLCKEVTEPTVFIGNGLNSYEELLASQLGNKFLQVRKVAPFTVAACAARLAETRFEANKCFDLNELNIKYVRKPEAELKSVN